MKRYLQIFAIILSAAVISNAQTEDRPSLSQLPDNGPFKIKPGSSFSASGSITGLSQPDPTTSERERIMSNLTEALGIVRDNYAGGAQKDLVKNAITGSLRALDPHSSYFDTAEFDELLDEQNGEYSGIGATIVSYQNNGVRDTFIISTVPGSAAASGHLRFGDKIVAVNGEKVSGEDSAVVRDKVRGKDGSVVRLQIERADSRSMTVDLRRSVVPQPSVPDSYMLRPGVGYVDMTEGFDFTTSGELSQALKDLHRQGMTSLIIDLRNNPGGILEQAVKVAEQFLPAGKVIVSQRGRTRIDNRVWRSTNRNPETVPLVLLVDEGTASASEVVAGALQDYDRALIIGNRTFGKGLVQSVLNLPGGAGLTLTAARYYTPSGRSIQRDYSNGSLYEYYNGRSNLSDIDLAKLEAHTSTNRKVFGGNGIQPDEVVNQVLFSRDQSALLDPIFQFARITSARSFADVKISAERVGLSKRIRSGDVKVDDELIAAFENYVRSDPEWKISDDVLSREANFVRSRLRYQLAVAAFGIVPANQVLAEDDPQIAKALEALPRAAQLAATAARIRQK